MNSIDQIMMFEMVVSYNNTNEDRHNYLANHEPISFIFCSAIKKELDILVGTTEPDILEGRLTLIMRVHNIDDINTEQRTQIAKSMVRYIFIT